MYKYLFRTKNVVYRKTVKKLSDTKLDNLSNKLITLNNTIESQINAKKISDDSKVILGVVFGLCFSTCGIFKYVSDCAEYESKIKNLNERLERFQQII
jgi:tetrahydromethanopterin S-methyltransferase subunit G